MSYSFSSPFSKFPGRGTIAWGSARASAKRAQHVVLATAAAAVRTTSTQGRSDVSAWHRQRRKMIIAAHPEVAQLEKSDWKGVLLLITCNVVLYACAAIAPSLHWLGVVVLALTVGATASLWQLTMLHEVVHGTMVKNGGFLQSFLLWAGSFPSVFGYFLYLRFGHLSHHNRLGAHAMAELFSSPSETFEDGDILFVTHRMKMAGAKGPMPPEWAAGKLPDAPMNVAFNFFSDVWRPNEPYRNMFVYSLSMFLERLVLMISDKVVAVTGYNAFFPNKPKSFHLAAANRKSCTHTQIHNTPHTHTLPNNTRTHTHTHAIHTQPHPKPHICNTHTNTPHTSTNNTHNMRLPIRMIGASVLQPHKHKHTNTQTHTHTQYTHTTHTHTT